MKIAIIGYSGCGKSTLAAYLGRKYNCNVLYLDCVHWQPGWKERLREEEICIVKEFMENNDSWVIDGNYSRVLHDQRMQQADKIIFMNFNRFNCLYRAAKRFVKYCGKTRESMTQGCPEKIDFEFVKWILRDGRTKKHKEKYKRILEQYNEKVTVIRNQRQLSAFYKNM